MNYIAPELLYSALGGDFRSDIYSLGVTLFEMLTGRLPFDGEDIAELASQHRQELPGDLRSLVPHLPTRAARLVHQMLAKEPLRRPPPRERDRAADAHWKSKPSPSAVGTLERDCVRNLDS